MTQRLHRAALVAIVLLALGTTVLMALRSRLWVDETFSLALATGHSLEHPAAEADPSLGDFQLEPGVRPISEWRRYLEHESPKASLARVVRATRLSDTSPPLYYVLLSIWTRVMGTTDFSVRAFSIVLFIGSIPLLAAVARRLGGRAAVVPACGLFAASPLALYYASEARMYSLLWFFTIACALAALRAREQHRRLYPILTFILASVGGFLTHYFFAFPWAAIVFSMAVSRGRIRWMELVIAVAAVGALLLPWYLRVPDLLSRWRVTKDWLTWRPAYFSRSRAAFDSVSQFFTGNVRGLWRSYAIFGWLSATVIGMAVLICLRNWRQQRMLRKWLLPAAWLVAGCVGPFVFDALRNTYTAAVPRYACGALPAASLLLGLLFARVAPRTRLVLLACLVTTWAPAVFSIVKLRDRSGFAMGFVHYEIRKKPTKEDLIMVHSIPSGVLTVARYLESQAPMAAWVEQLGARKIPADLSPLIEGRRDVFLVRIHAVGAPAPQEDWLRGHYKVVAEKSRPDLAVVRFRVRSAEGATDGKTEP
jgi:hypothetical protein